VKACTRCLAVIDTLQKKIYEFYVLLFAHPGQDAAPQRGDREVPLRAESAAAAGQDTLAGRAVGETDGAGSADVDDGQVVAVEEVEVGIGDVAETEEPGAHGIAAAVCETGPAGGDGDAVAGKSRVETTGADGEEGGIVAGELVVVGGFARNVEHGGIELALARGLVLLAGFEGDGGETDGFGEEERTGGPVGVAGGEVLAEEEVGEVVDLVLGDGGGIAHRGADGLDAGDAAAAGDVADVFLEMFLADGGDEGVVVAGRGEEEEEGSVGGQTGDGAEDGGVEFAETDGQFAFVRPAGRDHEIVGGIAGHEDGIAHGRWDWNGGRWVQGQSVCEAGFYGKRSPPFFSLRGKGKGQ
jgi:hypothetical protein